MAITYDASSKGVSSTTPLQFNHTIGSGLNRTLVVGIGFEDNDGADPVIVTSVTYNSVEMLPIDQSQSEPSGYYVGASLWYLLEADLPSTGSYEIYITGNSSPNRAFFGFAESFSGAKQSAPDDFGDTTDLPSSPLYHTLSIPRDNSIQIGLVACRNTGSYGTYNGSTIRNSYSQSSSSACQLDNFLDQGDENVGATHSNPNDDTVMAATWSPITLKIEGYVYDIDGEPVASADCFLCKDNGDDTQTFIDQTTTDSSGKYTFWDGEDINYIVYVRKADTPAIKDLTDRNIQSVDI